MAHVFFARGPYIRGHVIDFYLIDWLEFEPLDVLLQQALRLLPKNWKILRIIRIYFAEEVLVGVLDGLNLDLNSPS